MARDEKKTAAGATAGAMRWGDLAQTKVGDVEAPKSIPDGHYMALITGRGEVGNRGKKKNLRIAYPMKLTEPMDDVDSDDFAASDGFKDSYILEFWLTADSLYRFTDFGKGMGASEDYSVPEMAEWLASCGEPFVIKATNEPSSRNPERSFLNLDDPIPLSIFQANE